MSALSARMPQNITMGVSHLSPSSDAVFQSKQIQPLPIGSPLTDDERTFQAKFSNVHKPYDLFCSGSLEMLNFLDSEANNNSDNPELHYTEGSREITTKPTQSSNHSHFHPYQTNKTPYDTVHREIHLLPERSPNISPMRSHPHPVRPDIRRDDRSPSISPMRTRFGENSKFFGNDSVESDSSAHDPLWEEWILGMGGMELEDAKEARAVRGKDYLRPGFKSNPEIPGNRLLISPTGSLNVLPPTIENSTYQSFGNRTPAHLTAPWTSNSDPTQRKVHSPRSLHYDTSPSPSPRYRMNSGQESRSISPSPGSSPIFRQSFGATLPNPEIPSNSHQRMHRSPLRRLPTPEQNTLLSHSAPDNSKMDPPNNNNRSVSPFSRQPQLTENVNSRRPPGNYAEDQKLRLYLNAASSPPHSPGLPHASSSKLNGKGHSGTSSMPSSPSHHHSQYRYRHKAKANRHRHSTKKEEDLAKYEIHLERVRAGEDIRTTIMVKNIPNKYDQEMLLETINKKFKGTYDFFYLPIDFKNKCNVGYAFINFIEPLTVANFFEIFNLKRWEKFNSEKVCSMAYARIQGKNAFIDHFRNSSLMCEDPSCRPLIFHSNGPKQGTLEPFPPANISPARARFVSSNSSQNNFGED